jgi:hypothetical protein
MRLAVRKAAHVLERTGLALAGAACGMFVGAHVGTSIGALTTVAFLLAMIVVGAIGFYLGIDIPPQSHAAGSDGASSGKVDAVEFLSAVGTFCATLAAFASVSLVALHLGSHVALTGTILTGWLGGVAMQIIAGTIARGRR